MKDHAWIHDGAIRVLVKEASNSFQTLKSDLAGDRSIPGETLDGIGNVRATPYHDVHELSIELGVGAAIKSFQGSEFLGVSR